MVPLCWERGALSLGKGAALSQDTQEQLSEHRWDFSPTQRLVGAFLQDGDPYGSKSDYIYITV